MYVRILRGLTIIAILTLLLLSQVSCEFFDLFNTSGAQIELVQSAEERDLSSDVEEAELAELVAGNGEFALDLYQALREENENLFYSPYSISLALAMTYVGARGETEAQMAETLHFTLPQDNLHPAFNALDLELARRSEATDEEDGEGFRLNVANSIWGQTGYSFLSAFLDTLAINYGAGLRLLDFAAEPEVSRMVINEWVSEQTEGKIQDLLPQNSITPATRLVLTNAIYFNAAWHFPFDPALTCEDPFETLDGEQVTVPMMTQTQLFGYARGDGYQAVELPYHGQELSMVVLLPQGGRFAEFENSLNEERLDAILNDLQPRSVELTMPRFSYSSAFSLKKALTTMGMPIAFSAGADFSGMDGSRNLFISDVLHQAFVSVDEAGTEAAAATAVVVPETSAEPPVQVMIDRPFIFLIRDIKTQAILFIGRVVNPVS